MNAQERVFSFVFSTYTFHIHTRHVCMRLIWPRVSFSVHCCVMVVVFYYYFHSSPCFCMLSYMVCAILVSDLPVFNSTVVIFFFILSPPSHHPLSLHCRVFCPRISARLAHDVCDLFLLLLYLRQHTMAATHKLSNTNIGRCERSES